MGVCCRWTISHCVGRRRALASFLANMGASHRHRNGYCHVSHGLADPEYQNRNSRAINLKLNELFRAMDNARNQLIDIERLSDLELDEMQATCEKIKTSWTNRQTRTPRGAEEKLHWASRSSGRSKAWGTALVVFLLILRPGRAP